MRSCRPKSGCPSRKRSAGLPVGIEPRGEFAVPSLKKIKRVLEIVATVAAVAVVVIEKIEKLQASGSR